MNIINYKSLIQHNTFNIDIKARQFVKIQSEDDILNLLNYKYVDKKHKLVLGGGSNILFTKDLDGLVIHNTIKGINIIKEYKHNSIVELGAGEIWHDVVIWSINKGLYGLENLALIPGYVGAAPIQNIGAYGVELNDTFESLDAIHLTTKEQITFTKSDCKFGYRDSIFKNQYRNEFIITKVRLKLSKNKNINLSYKALEQEVKKLNKNNITCKDISKLVIKIRTKKLPDPKKIGNAGSFFKNPIISKNILYNIQKKYPDIPFYETNEIKIPAGWLIEKLKWKGYKNKNCGVYSKQALVLINHSNSTGKEIQNLANKIKQEVFQTFNIKLEEEVLIL